MARLYMRLMGVLLIVLVCLITGFIVIGQQSQAELIAFMAVVDDETDIYLYDPLGHEFVNLTLSPHPEWSFGWSGDGDLLYTASVNPGQVADELFVMSRLGLSELVETPDTLYAFGSVWSPDGSTLAYFSSHPSNYSDIYTISFPELSIENLTQTETISETNPQWTPDGEHLMYRIDGNLYLYHLESGESRLLLNLAEPIESPVWSPNGDWLAFYVRRFIEGRNTLAAYVVSSDGKQLIELALDADINDSAISWSPDSQQMVMIADDTNLLIYDLMTGDVEQILGDQTRFSPVWSPMGRWIAFVENRQLHFYDLSMDEIHILEVDGRVKSPLIWQP